MVHAKYLYLVREEFNHMHHLWADIMEGYRIIAYPFFRLKTKNHNINHSCDNIVPAKDELRLVYGFNVSQHKH